MKVARALGACQLVEFELKFYISQALELCQKRTAGLPPFDMKGSDYDSAPLGRLVSMFEKLSDCPTLVKRLTTFKTERDFLAHRAIAACLDPDGGYQPEEAKKILGRLENVENDAFALIDAIRDESGKWLGHLYFDSIDERA